MPSCFIQVKLNGERYESVDYRELDPQDLTTRLLGLIVGYPGENYSEAIQLRMVLLEIAKALFRRDRSEQYNGTRIFGKGSQTTLATHRLFRKRGPRPWRQRRLILRFFQGGLQGYFLHPGSPPWKPSGRGVPQWPSLSLCLRLGSFFYGGVVLDFCEGPPRSRRSICAGVHFSDGVVRGPDPSVADLCRRWPP